MEDLVTRVTRIHRPALLIDAARRALAGFDRAQHLPGLLGNTPRTGAAVVALIDLEARLETDRRDRTTRYRASRHVLVLAALLAEYEALLQARTVGGV